MRSIAGPQVQFDGLDSDSRAGTDLIEVSFSDISVWSEKSIELFIGWNVALISNLF